MFNKRTVIAVGIMVCAMFLMAQANFYPERIYKERTKTKLNTGWKFFKITASTPLTGDPSLTAYDDATWKTVNIPHSASYDAPTKTAEDASFIGTCWYRKHFTVPASALHKGKMFLEFEGAMQVADVWLNGKKLGTHSNSGYTWFSFDITDSGVVTSGDNVLSVQLVNNYSTAVPPGNPGDGNGPDYYLFSGLYRDVWLVCTDKCYIPLYGQQISIPNLPKAPSTDSAYVRIKTTVRNEYTTSKNVTVRYVLAFDEKSINKSFLIDSSTALVGAGQTMIFDKTTAPILHPHLWSTTDPYLYRVFTQVYIDGVLADDNVDRFGVRWCTWDNGGNFKLNGQTLELKGSSLHQMFPWIQNAVPSSRFYKDLQLAKDMGINMIRCAHYPRSPAYYNALDELGLLCYVEVPTWGNGKSENYYPSQFWDRLLNCMNEMIQVGYNHPSIIGWGLFNEPGGDFVARMTALNDRAHTLDSTRMTYTANNNSTFQILNIPDICGLNYMAPSYLSVTPKPTRYISTEYHVGWTYDYAFRGDANDIDTAIAAHFWKDWAEITNTPAFSGGTMWCHADYNSPMTLIPMGAVDAYRIPKSTYYLFRKNLMGVADDEPIVGLTPTRVKLEADSNKLIADSVDCAFVYASIRDANGKCVHTGSKTTTATNVSFTVSGPANFFGTSSVAVAGGKCGILVKSKNTPGTIMVIATSPGLQSDTVTITSNADAYSTVDYPFFSPIITARKLASPENISISQTGRNVKIVFPSLSSATAHVSLVNIKGQAVVCPATLTGKSLSLDTKLLAPGFYYLSVAGNKQDLSTMRKILISK